MNPLVIGFIVFACVFGAGLIGMRLRDALPDHHLSKEAKDSVRITMELVATMAALVLGLLVASTKEAYDSESRGVTELGAKVAFLDGLLANCGPEAKGARAVLRQALEGTLLRLWSGSSKDSAVGELSAHPGTIWAGSLPQAIQGLNPQSSPQRAFQERAFLLAIDLGQMRWLMSERLEDSISRPLLVLVIAWLTIIFGSVGLFAPRNGTVVVSLFLAALSVAGALFIILELDHPFDGFIRISQAPISNTLKQLVLAQEK
jgi:hypothetical protein